MKVVELHPEDLLDKEMRDELTDSEQARLEAHLERCATCRFEREVRADFADELEDSPSSQGSMQRLFAMMESGAPADDSGPVRIEDDAGEAPTLTEPEDEARVSTRPPTSRRGRKTMRVALLVAAAILVGGVATASGSAARVWDRLTAAWSDAPEVEAPVRAPAPSGMPAVFSSAMARAPERQALPEEPAPAPTPIEVPVTAPARSTPPVESAAVLFDAANEARRQGDYARAIAIHQRLEATHPKSREAHVSHATVGRLLLDRGDAAGALASFDAYQARGPGALDEAAMVGRATALERLGRTDEARIAWRALLAAFPETPYAEHARSRTEGARVP